MPRVRVRKSRQVASEEVPEYRVTAGDVGGDRAKLLKKLPLLQKSITSLVSEFDGQQSVEYTDRVLAQVNTLVQDLNTVVSALAEMKEATHE